MTRMIASPPFFIVATLPSKMIVGAAAAKLLSRMIFIVAGAVSACEPLSLFLSSAYRQSISKRMPVLMLNLRATVLSASSYMAF